MSAPLSLRRNPVRLVLSRDLWAGAWYLLAYQLVGWALLAAAAAAASTAAVFAITLAGLPLLVTAALPAVYSRVPRDGVASRFLPVKDFDELARRRDDIRAVAEARGMMPPKP